MRVLLMSGGIESTCLAYMLRPDVCLTINYGQRCFGGEANAAESIAKHLNLNHARLTVDAASIGSGQMAGRDAIDSAKIPEFWPFRNQFLITVTAMKYAHETDLKILIGSVKGDSSHQDGTKSFFSQMNAVLQMQEGAVTLEAPAIEFESIELLRRSDIDADLLDMTFSCFQAEIPCGQCRGCWKNEGLRASYFNERPTCHR